MRRISLCLICAGGKFGFQLGDVGEIIRVPNLARMPLAPQSLVGLANLHGVVLPVVDLRRLLGLPGAPLDEAARVIVIARRRARWLRRRSD